MANGLIIISILLLVGCQKGAEPSKLGVVTPPTVRIKYKAAVIQSNPTLYWRLAEAESNGLVREQIRGNLGQLKNGYTVSSTGGVFNTSQTSILFNGLTSTMSTSNEVSIENVFSIELWFNASASGGTLASFGADKTVIYMTESGRIVFGMNVGTIVTCATSSSYNDSHWHQVVATFTEAGGLKLYLDGQLSVSLGSGQIFSNSGKWDFGGQDLTSWPDRPTRDYFNGNLDEVSVYTSELLPSAIGIHYRIAIGQQ